MDDRECSFCGKIKPNHAKNCKNPKVYKLPRATIEKRNAAIRKAWKDRKLLKRQGTASKKMWSKPGFKNRRSETFRKTLTEKNEIRAKSIKRELAKREIILLDEYRGSSGNKQTLQCQKSHKWKARIVDVLSGHGCPECSFQKTSDRLQLTTVEVKKRLKKINPDIKIIGKYKGAMSPLKCLCLICKHIWKPIWSMLNQGTGCPKCAGVSKLSTIEVKQRLKKINPSIRIIGEYKGTSLSIKCKCLKCHYVWNPIWNNLKQGQLCPKCYPHRFGKTEQQVRKIIERVTGWKFPRKRPSFLKGWSSHPMELDGYNKRHKVAFEYNGEGRRRKKPIFGRKAFNNIKRNDERKRKLCEYHGVTLIVVSYWKQDVEGFIRKKLEKLSFL